MPGFFASWAQEPPLSTLTKAQRDKLPESDFGDVSRRLFPIVDQDDVDSAARLIGKAHDPAAVQQRVASIARRKGLKLPDAWQADTAEHAVDFGEGEYFVGPEFSLA